MPLLLCSSHRLQGTTVYGAGYGQGQRWQQAGSSLYCLYEPAGGGVGREQVLEGETCVPPPLPMTTAKPSTSCSHSPQPQLQLGRSSSGAWLPSGSTKDKRQWQVWWQAGSPTPLCEPALCVAPWHLPLAWGLQPCLDPVLSMVLGVVLYLPLANPASVHAFYGPPPPNERFKKFQCNVYSHIYLVHIYAAWCRWSLMFTRPYESKKYSSVVYGMN